MSFTRINPGQSVHTQNSSPKLIKNNISCENWHTNFVVKVKVKVTFSLEQATKAQRGSRRIALDGGGWSTPRPGSFAPRKDPVRIAQEAGWAPGPVWTGAENLAHTGIRSPDRPARSQSLYRIRYPGRSQILE